MCYDVCCDEENNAHIFIGFYSELARMCVQGEKKNELSNKSKQSNNNERFSLKVPRAD